MKRIKIYIPVPETDNKAKVNLINNIRQVLINNTILSIQNISYCMGLDLPNKERQFLYYIDIIKFINNSSYTTLIKELLQNTSLKHYFYLNVDSILMYREQDEDIKELNNMLKDNKLNKIDFNKSINQFKN